MGRSSIRSLKLPDGKTATSVAGLMGRLRTNGAPDELTSAQLETKQPLSALLSLEEMDATQRTACFLDPAPRLLLPDERDRCWS